MNTAPICHRPLPIGYLDRGGPLCASVVQNPHKSVLVRRGSPAAGVRLSTKYSIPSFAQYSRPCTRSATRPEPQEHAAGSPRSNPFPTGLASASAQFEAGEVFEVLGAVAAEVVLGQIALIGAGQNGGQFL